MGAPRSTHRDTTVSDAGTGDLFRAVTAMSDDAIFTCDKRGQVITWSDVAERLFGAPADEVLDARFETLFATHLRPEVRGVIAAVLAGDQVRHFETEILRPDGMPVPVSLSMCPVFERGERVAGSLVIARDITEQRLAQATLGEVEARLEAGEALAHVGSWLWDVRTGAVQLSAEFYRIHRLEPLEFDGTLESYLGLVDPVDRERVRAAMLRAVETGHPFEGTYRVVHPDGEVGVVEVRAQPTIDSAGTAMGLRGIGHDVTDRVDVTDRGSTGVSGHQPVA